MRYDENTEFEIDVHNLPPETLDTSNREIPSVLFDIYRDHRQSKLPAFTLAELLIALAILGVIATFTIPKVLSSQESSQKKAVYRETIAALSEAVHTGQLTGELSGLNFQTYLFGKINAVKLCADADNDGCWTQATPGGGSSKAGFTLHNGAAVSGIDEGSGGPDYRNAFYIDWNGESGPNLEGDDQMRVRACWGTTNCSSSQPVGTLKAEPGIAASVNMYTDIFSP